MPRHRLQPGEIVLDVLPAQPVHRRAAGRVLEVRDIAARLRRGACLPFRDGHLILADGEGLRDPDGVGGLLGDVAFLAAHAERSGRQTDEDRALRAVAELVAGRGGRQRRLARRRERNFRIGLRRLRLRPLRSRGRWPLAQQVRRDIRRRAVVEADLIPVPPDDAAGDGQPLSLRHGP